MEDEGEEERTVLSLCIGDSGLGNNITDRGTRGFLCAVESSVGVLVTASTSDTSGSDASMVQHNDCNSQDARLMFRPWAAEASREK